MNKFTFSSLKSVLFAVFLAIVLIVLAILFFGPCYRSDRSPVSGTDIPAVVYLTEPDASETDISATDVSETDLSGSDTIA